MAAGLLAGCGCSCPHIRLRGQLASYRSSSSGAIWPAAQELSPTAAPELQTPPSSAPELSSQQLLSCP
eukprot:425038-Prymnesium_polylepis.1